MLVVISLESTVCSSCSWQPILVNTGEHLIWSTTRSVWIKAALCPISILRGGKWAHRKEDFYHWMYGTLRFESWIDLNCTGSSIIVIQIGTEWRGVQRTAWSHSTHSRLHNSNSSRFLSLAPVGFSIRGKKHPQETLQNNPRTTEKGGGRKTVHQECTSCFILPSNKLLLPNPLISREILGNPSLAAHNLVEFISCIFRATIC